MRKYGVLTNENAEQIRPWHWKETYHGCCCKYLILASVKAERSRPCAITSATRARTRHLVVGRYQKERYSAVCCCCPARILLAELLDLLYK